MVIRDKTFDELMVEGERLAKPSLLLSTEPSDLGVVAVWGGRGCPAHRGREDDQHRITFDCAWLARIGIDIRGSVGIYDVARRWNWPKPIHVSYDPDHPLDALIIADGTRLYAHEAASFPPIQALCLYGGDAVAAWLRANGWQRTDYDAAEASDLGERYSQEWMNRCPLYSSGWAAALHGWHMRWPEDDFYMPAEMALLLWTFWDAEPWIEVWKRNHDFRVELRIT
ncbi:MAG: hypothetical protein HYX69_13870 [Planctomycetia bacterium]|nr:hypothetical protein [Planctomycetia bacterium]